MYNRYCPRHISTFLYNHFCMHISTLPEKYWLSLEEWYRMMCTWNYLSLSYNPTNPAMELPTLLRTVFGSTRQEIPDSEHDITDRKGLRSEACTKLPKLFSFQINESQKQYHILMCVLTQYPIA